MDQSAGEEIQSGSLNKVKIIQFFLIEIQVLNPSTIKTRGRPKSVNTNRMLGQKKKKSRREEKNNRNNLDS